MFTGMKKEPNGSPAIEYLIVATHLKVPHTMQVYANSWTIECFFKAIKTAGFNRIGDPN